MKKLLFSLLTIIFTLSCNNELHIQKTEFPEKEEINDTDNVNEDPLKFSIITDPHIYNTDLGTGSSLKSVQEKDTKMIIESESILRSYLNKTRTNKYKFILIPGDLTKDGAYESHALMANILEEIEDSGVEVYVVPGNHDINSQLASSYEGSQSKPTDFIYAAEFEIIYKNFGYNDAIYKDENSLSYIAEPAADLWLFAIDSNDYDPENKIKGLIKGDTLQWIEEKLVEAKQKNKKVIGMMHHNIMFHVDVGNSQAESLLNTSSIENKDIIADRLARNGLKTMFTGHYHVHDIVKKSFSGNDLYDITTGSLTTFPCPYRTITLNKNHTLEIKTDYIDEIEFDIGEQSFPEYAEFILDRAMDEFINPYINQIPLNEETKELVIPFLKRAMKEHMQGDEEATPEDYQKLGDMEQDQLLRFVAPIIEGFLSDLPPGDNNITINLNIENNI